MYGSREFEIALITLSVAVAACCIADYGVGIMFGVLTSGAACFAVICIYQLADLSSTKRSRAGQSAGMAVRGLMPGLEDDHDRFVRGQDRNPNGDVNDFLPMNSLAQHGSDPAPRPAAAPATPRGFLF